MTDHPITPPPELKVKWIEEDKGGPGVIGRIIDRAAQSGADQELEACIAWLRNEYGYGEELARRLCAARRPKPSLKKQACDALDAYIYGNPDHNDKQNTYNTIRRALEALPE